MADNNIQTQVKSFFGKLGMPQKIIIVTVPVLVIGLLLYFFVSGGAKEQAVLFSGLEQSDAGKIVEILKTNQTSYELKDNGSTILVDKDKVMDTRISLASQGLPESSVVGYELFDKTNLGMSEFVQKLNYRRALEGELSKTISALDEVKKARVHIVIPEKALFMKDQKEPTASVTLQLKSGKNLNQRTVEGIQTLISSSVEGMNTNNVSVLDHKGKLLSVPEIDVNTVAGLTAQQYEQQKSVEEYLTGKAQSMLDNVLGMGNANVRLNAELDFTKIDQTKTDYDPEKQVIRSEQTILESNKITDSLNLSGPNTDKSQSNVIQNYEISQVVEHISNGVGGIKRLSVAAMINSTPKIIDSGGIKSVTYIPRTNEEIQKLTEIIKNAVGYNPERNDQITVTNVQFDSNLEDFELEIAPKLEWYQEPYNQKLILLMGIILITIFLMYRFMQSKIIRERVRIALELPGKAELSVDLDTESQQQQMVDELNFDDNLMLLPSELPEQLLLEGDIKGRAGENDNFVLDSNGAYPSKGSLKGRKALTGHNVELDEENMMKIEIRNKVQDYIETNSEDAARLVRILIAQDPDERRK
jgi:flagellar M-ring protein FliF